jgi:hypothetical protein
VYTAAALAAVRTAGSLAWDPLVQGIDAARMPLLNNSGLFHQFFMYLPLDITTSSTYTSNSYIAFSIVGVNVPNPTTTVTFELTRITTAVQLASDGLGGVRGGGVFH